MRLATTASLFLLLASFMDPGIAGEQKTSFVPRHYQGAALRV